MRKEQSRGITIPDFEIQYKAILIKTKTDIQVVEQDREPRNKSTLSGQLINNKGGKNIH